MKKLIFCKIFDLHDWGAKVKEGVTVTWEDLETVESFKKVSIVYCKRCGKLSKFNI